MPFQCVYPYWLKRSENLQILENWQDEAIVLFQQTSALSDLHKLHEV
jgi:hypothetical protein